MVVAWSGLSRSAKAFRIAHGSWAAIGLASVGYIWTCAATGRRDGLLYAAVLALSVEGAALVVGRGNCPLGPLQGRLGDPIPLFELVLPPRAAKAVIPVLAVVAVAGLIALSARRGAAPPSREGVR